MAPNSRRLDAADEILEILQNGGFFTAAVYKSLMYVAEEEGS